MSGSYQDAAAAALSKGNVQENGNAEEIALYISAIPVSVQLETPDQISRFELLRLALFVIKLRKLEKLSSDEPDHAFARNLLQHAIFQQVLTLTQLGERKQALMIINAYRKN